MASLTQDAKQNCRILFVNVDRASKTGCTGKIDKKSVAAIKFRIEQLIERAAKGQPMGLDLAE